MTAGPGNETLAEVLDGLAARGGTGDRKHRPVEDEHHLLGVLTQHGRGTGGLAGQCRKIQRQGRRRQLAHPRLRDGTEHGVARQGVGNHLFNALIPAPTHAVLLKHLGHLIQGACTHP